MQGEEDEENMQIMQEAWHNVNGGENPIGEVKAARGEEVGYMVNRQGKGAGSRSQGFGLDFF